MAYVISDECVSCAEHALRPVQLVLSLLSNAPSAISCYNKRGCRFTGSLFCFFCSFFLLWQLLPLFWPAAVSV